MKNKDLGYGSYNGLSYRICYGLTKERKMDYSKQLYEFTKDCKCNHCNNRFKYEKEVRNNITITTDDKSKFQEAYAIISSYTCNSDNANGRLFVRL